MPTPLHSSKIEKLRTDYPWLPEDYFDYLARVGWGQTASGRMIYEVPVESREIYGQVDTLDSIVLLGDDFQGYCFGYNLKSECYGEVAQDGTWEPWPEGSGISNYVDDSD